MDKKNFGVVMTCGCAAYSQLKCDKDYVWGCGVHNNTEVNKSQPSLEGRVATCDYGNHGHTPSSKGLAFFRYCPEQDTDKYYCGCWGWD